jgi:hypothetical protein
MQQIERLDRGFATINIAILQDQDTDSALQKELRPHRERR